MAKCYDPDTGEWKTCEPDWPYGTVVHPKSWYDETPNWKEDYPNAYNPYEDHGNFLRDDDYNPYNFLD